MERHTGSTTGNGGRRAAAVLLLAGLAGCAGMPGWEPDTTMADVLAERIETAHGARAWETLEVVAGDLTLYFNEQRAFDASFFYAPHQNRARFETADGTLLVFDGERAWVSPASAEASMARFHLLTWPYFLAAPFKLLDPGTRRQGLDPVVFQNRRHNRLRLTFDPGVGDTPDDWYIVYADAATNRLVALGYIVTYGTDLVEAEREPHAIVYAQEQRVDGLLLATRWWFHHFSRAEGPHGGLLGRGELTNLRTEPYQEALFVAPADAREDTLPVAGSEEAE